MLTPDYVKVRRPGGSPLKALILANADLRILISAITFFSLLLILLTPDGYLGPSFMSSGWIPAPLPQ